MHVQIVRQITLPQNLFEPECECTRHHRIPAGLPEQIVLFLQFPSTTLFFLPRTFFLPDTKQFAEFFRQIYHPHPRTGLRFFHQDRLAAQLNYIAPDMQRPLAPVDVRPPQAAGLAPPHARGEDQLEIDLVFQALAFQRCDKPLHCFLIRHRPLLRRAFFPVCPPCGIVRDIPCLHCIGQDPAKTGMDALHCFFSQQSACLPVLFRAHRIVESP